MIATTKIIMDLKTHKKIKIYVKIKRPFGEELGESLKTTKKYQFAATMYLT